MADYDLGTAHGRIVVDYDGRGVQETEKDLESLRQKAKRLLGEFGDLAKNWRSRGQDMANTAANVARGIGLITAGAVAAKIAMNGFGGSLGFLDGLPGLVSDIGTAFGGIPDGMENFPTAIQRVVRLNAAVAVLSGTLGLLARSTAGLRGIRVVTGLLGAFGTRISALAAPLRLVSSLAFGAVTAIQAFGLTKQIIKIFGALTLALGALGGTIHVVTGLAASIRDLGKAALLLPAVIGAAGFAMATFKIGILGVGDALKAMDDPAKFAEALKKLAPAAQEFVKAVKAINDNGFKQLKLDVQQTMFRGLAQIVTELGNKYMPILQDRMGRVAETFNRTGTEIGAMLLKAENIRNVDSMFSNFENIIENLAPAIAPFLEVLIVISKIGSEVFLELTKGAEGAANKFRDWVKSAEGTAKIRLWMQQGVQAVKDLVAIVGNLGRIFTTVFDGLSQGSGQTFLGFLRQATERMLAFLKSAEGQRVLAMLGTMLENAYQSATRLADGFIKYILPAIEAFLPFIERMSTAVGDGLVGAMSVLGPVFQVLGTVLSALSPILGPIVTALVFLTTTGIGLAIAVGVVTKALLLLRVAMLAVRGVSAAAGLAFRLITGNLGPAERAVLRFIGLIGQRLVQAIGAAVRSSKLLKFGGLAAGLGIVAVKLNDFNLAAAGGDPAKLGMMEGKLNDLVEAGKLLAAGNFGEIFRQIGVEFEALGQKWAAGEAPIQQWAVSAGTALSNFGTTVNTKFNEAVLFVQTLPARISAALVNFGTTLYTSALNAWNQFKLGTEQKFIELGGTVGTLPYRIGVAIGSLIGMALRWAVDTWNSFITGSETKFNEIVTGAQALPGRIGAAVSGLASTLGNQASTSWSQFKARALAFMNQAIADVRAFPGKAGAAISGLASQLGAKAVEAWNRFKTSAAAGISQAIADVRALPGKAAAALGNIGNVLFNAGRNLIQGFVNGIRSMIGAAQQAAAGLVAGVRRYFPFSPAKEGPLSGRGYTSYAGQAMIADFAKGMRSNESLIRDAAMAATKAANLRGIFDFRQLGSLAGQVNLSGQGSAVTTGASAYAGVPPRGDGASAPTQTFTISKVEIPAKDVAEMKNVSEFFAAVQQKARAGKASG